MKFRQKIFLVTFAFVTISINLIGIIIINNNYNLQINNKIENNKIDIRNIENMLSFYGEGGLNSSLLNKNKTSYEILKNDDVIYTNNSIDNNIKEMLKPSEDEIKVIISNKELFMAVRNNDYDIILVEDITDVFDNRQEQINFFIKISFSFSFIIAICLYIVILFLTRRINKLEKTIDKIKKGDYSVRVEKLGNDEIGNLAQSFNEMVDSVDNNITEIQRISENRKNFIHNITHEIRTPLTSIIGYSSLIKNAKISDKEKIIEYNNKIYEEGNYLNLISDRLIDIVLLDNKKIELEDINISENINTIIDNNKCIYRDVEFIKNIQDNIIIKSDKVLLFSLVTNILKNAVVACENKNKKIVEIILEEITYNQIVLKIKDNGKGMSEKQIQKITEPFYTSNKDRNRKSSGMGLGLPLCEKICEVLNATLDFKSKEEYGTTVIIKFNKKEETNL
jgi:signal transduction histidine kinase